MKSFHFLSKHPKFEVEFPTDRSKPPTKHPNSFRCADTLDKVSDTNFDREASESFVRLPKSKERPAVREYSKRVDAINLIVDKVSQQVNTSRENTSSIHDMWTKIETAIKTTSEHMRRITENQIMSNAPSPIKKAYFENLYQSITAVAETHATETENQRKMADLKRRELDLKERSIQLGESLLAEEEKEEGKRSDDVEVDLVRDQPTEREVSICGDENKSRWLLLMETGLVVEAHHLCNA